MASKRRHEQLDKKTRSGSAPGLVGFPIANFVTCGVSTRMWRESFKQFHEARTEFLKPQGADALREQVWARWHFAKVWTYRELIARARR